MKKKLFVILFIFLLWGIGGFAQSSSVTVTPITADYTANPPTVTFKVSWDAGTRDAVTHRSKVWLLVDYRRIINDVYTGDWLRAGIAATPTANIGVVSLETGNTKGFWLQGSDGAFAATVTVPVTVNLTGYAPEFGWCGVASDRPPTAIEYPGYYALQGTKDFIIQTHPTDASQIITRSTAAYDNCIYSLTDSTGCPGDVPAMPAITDFTASTTTICRDGSVTLTASASNAASYSFNNGAWSSSSTTVVSPTSTTTYTLSVRSASGCTVPYPTAVTITVNDPPVPQSLSAVPDVICAGESATLTAAAVGAASYSLNGSTWTESYQLTDYTMTTTTYTLYIKSAAGCTAILPNAATVTVHPAFSPGAITTASGTTSPGTDPNVTIANSSAASGGDGSITYQWRRSGDSSATLSLNSSTYPLNNNSTNYSTEGTYYFTRYAHDEFCNTAWAASSGQYTLTVAVSTPPSAGTNTYTCGTQTWSEPVRIAACNTSSFTNDDTTPYCRSYTYNSIMYYYYNWAYVNTYGSTTMCPGPWRVPTVNDLFTLIECLGASPTDGVYYPEASTYGGSLAGLASGTDIELYNPRGWYWGSEISGPGDDRAISLTIQQDKAYVASSYRMWGMQVRCVR